MGLGDSRAKGLGAGVQRQPRRTDLGAVVPEGKTNDALAEEGLEILEGRGVRDDRGDGRALGPLQDRRDKAKFAAVRRVIVRPVRVDVVDSDAGLDGARGEQRAVALPLGVLRGASQESSGRGQGE